MMKEISEERSEKYPGDRKVICSGFYIELNCNKINSYLCQVFSHITACFLRCRWSLDKRWLLNHWSSLYSGASEFNKHER